MPARVRVPHSSRCTPCGCGVTSRAPIPRYEQQLRADGVLDEAKVAAIRDRATAKVEDAVAFAKGSPTPDPTLATDFVFA